MEEETQTAEENKNIEQEVPVINIILDNDSHSQSSTGSSGVPLFIRKLWKMVNHESADIVGWNENGDGFIIHNQLLFLSNLLPKYFKHNQLSSFVRQLNLYDFHKVQHTDKDEFEFMHCFFLKGFPQLLPLIKRKSPTVRNKQVKRDTSVLDEITDSVEEVKSKSNIISEEIDKLRQENAALWREMNSLRLKYTKQTRIINKLIHFLISYMQKHPTVIKHNKTVSTNSNKSLNGPKIMELDYNYKNPSDFWTDFDSQQNNGQTNMQDTYIVTEPEQNLDTDFNTDILENAPTDLAPPNNETLPSDLNEVNPECSSMSALQTVTNANANLGYMIDNTQVELSNLKELLNNLSPNDMSEFYKLVNDNFMNQGSEGTSTADQTESDETIYDKELKALSQLSHFTGMADQLNLEAMDTNENNSPPEGANDISDSFFVDQFLNSG